MIEAGKANKDFKKLGLTIPVILLIGFVVGLAAAIVRVADSGDWSYGLWRTVLADITSSLNIGIYTGFHVVILLFLLAAVQLSFGRDFGDSLRTSIGLLLFYPLYLILVWGATKIAIVMQHAETHRLPTILRDNADFGLYMKKQFLNRIDIFSVIKHFFLRTWWMLSSILVASIFGVWFNRAFRKVRWPRRWAAKAASGDAGERSPWTGRLLIPLAFAIGAVIIVNMAHMAAALANQEPRPNVVLISIDTLRADRLGCYGNEQEITPYLDLLAKNGVLFEEAISNSSWTLPGHGAMLTGVQPTAMGLFKVTDRLDSHALTLAEVMRENGFDTGAIVSYILLDQVYGFHQGFEHFDYKDQQPAAKIVDKAIEYVGERIDKKFFLFLHLYDPHWPYEPSEEVSKQFWPGHINAAVRRLVAETDYARFALQVIFGPPELNQFSLAMYNGEISEVDRELGRFFRFLYDKQIIDRTLLVVTSDHGEEFLDHGYFGHGLTLYDEALKVPLIMRFPLMLPENTRVKGQVQLLDVFSTILELVGLDSSQYPLGGRDLLGMIHAGVADPVPMIAETSMSGDPRFSLRDGKHKIVTPYKIDLGGSLQIDKPDELFDLVADPLELQNLAADQPQLMETMQREMARQMEHIRETWGMGEGLSRSQALSAEEREHLRSLGYLN